MTLNLPIQEICRKYENGITPNEIAKEYNVSIPTIYNRLNKGKPDSEKHKISRLICRNCNIVLIDDNWCKSNQYPIINRICNKCYRGVKNQEDYKRSNRKSMLENKNCSSYLGVTIAECILSYIYSDVQRMSYGNPGYDFICGKGYKIDVKSRCMSIRKKISHSKSWNFHIRKNKIADYFICLAFDNREDLNPQYVWLIPASRVNHLMGFGISESRLDKWIEYEQPINKILSCCNTMRGGI